MLVILLKRKNKIPMIIFFKKILLDLFLKIIKINIIDVGTIKIAAPFG